MRRLPIAPVLLLLLAPVAPAEDSFPDIAPEAIPVAGTCAPLDEADATFIAVGPTGLTYRVSGRDGAVDGATLSAILAERSGTRGSAASASRHSVWITADKDKPSRGAFNAIMACRGVGIFRVGLVVRPESGGSGRYGFPFFLPSHAAASVVPGAAPAAKAFRMEVRVQDDAATPSDPRFLYEASRRATLKFGTIVADASVHAGVRLQDAVSSVDMLWRGGCTAVRLSLRGLVGVVNPRSAIRILVLGQELGSDAASVEIPRIQPRKSPWGDDGAAQPGANALLLQDIPGESAPASPTAKVLKNHAREPSGVPDELRRQAEGVLTGWARAVAKDLGEATRGRLPAAGRLAQRMVEPAKAARLLAPAKDTFATAERVGPATLRAEAYLLQGPKIVGKVDTTIHVAGAALSVVFASWVTEAFPEISRLPPEIVDPFAAGTAGHLRVWLEGMFATAKRDGAAGIPLAPEREVLALLPPVAHAGVRAQLAGRLAQADALAQWLRATAYDRIVILPPEGTVAVWSRGRIDGILRFSLEAEESDLRIVTLTARAAPR